MSIWDGRMTVTPDKATASLLLRVTVAAERTATAQERIATALEKLSKLAEVRIPRPGKPTVQVFSHFRKGVLLMLKFKVTMPAFDATNPNDDDVTTRKLSVTIGSGTPIDVVAGPSDTEVNNDGFVGNDGDEVVLFLVDEDASGNAGPASVGSFTLADTIPPPSPGAPGVEVTGQV